MTREEIELAITYLEEMKESYIGGVGYERYALPEYFAIENAIKALEQEPILDKISKMKSEIADSLEFWDYSPNNNPLARDMLETITHFLGDIREVEE